MIHQILHTNLSKYTCRFSEWPWNTVTEYPSALEMNDYLTSYAEEYVDNLHYNCKVTHVESLEVGGSRVEWMENNDKKVQKDFVCCLSEYRLGTLFLREDLDGWCS